MSTKDAIAHLIDQHAPHGYAGVMRAPGDGCPIYVAAVVLFDALGIDDDCAHAPGAATTKETGDE